MIDLRGIREFLKDSFGYIIVIAIVFLLFVFVISIQVVYGSSMNPNYENNDLVILSKISYKITDIKDGDVIALSSSDGEMFIKRVIASEGEDINVINGIVYVNGIMQSEEYLAGHVTDDFYFNDVCFIDGCEKGLIPEDYYFVMGDNREDSLDSRSYGFGLVHKDNIIGKVVFRIWPINKLGFVI